MLRLLFARRKEGSTFMKHLKSKIMLIIVAVVVVAVLILTAENKLLVSGIIVAALLIAFALFKLIKYLLSAYYKSTKDSYFSVLFNREKSLRYKVFKHFNKKVNGIKRCICDVYIPKADGTTAKADMLIIAETGVWVIDVKNYSGKMKGDELALEWEYTHGSSTEKIPSPTLSNKLYMKWFKAYVPECPSMLCFSYVVYGNGCKIKDVRIKTNDAVVATPATLKKELTIQLARLGTSLGEAEVSLVYDRFKALTDAEVAKNVTSIPGIQEIISYNTKTNKFAEALANDVARDAEENN